MFRNLHEGQPGRQMQEGADSSRELAGAAVWTLSRVCVQVRCQDLRSMGHVVRWEDDTQVCAPKKDGTSLSW